MLTYSIINLIVNLNFDTEFLFLYRRQQVDHIVNHLKIYSQNSAEFRAAIGEHRMGKVPNSYTYMHPDLHM